ncbi:MULTISPECIES: chromate transporter [Acidocella]|uniref:chromate transporter n=1 Tax=Acidocella TaxID=50709 RepID=UPI00028C37CD|nr:MULTISPECIES: chromate transporter [Acidocella]EKN01360.1 Chromate transport protein ChrA [Acidocella sp. MX-AZ02]WBO60887.1 chromate transporter [Acidocella sp. MX-AZ03]
MNILGEIALLFGKLSLLAVGGANSTVPELAQVVVNQKHWLTASQFAQLYAIANTAPGPNVILVTVIGAHVAGVVGGLLATLCMVLPAGIVAAMVAALFNKHRQARWRRVAQASLLPLTAGLVLATSYVLVRQSDTGWLTALLTAATTLLAWRTRLHPLWMFGAGALLGLVFLN